MIMQNNQKAKEKEVMQNDQDGVRDPETFDIFVGQSTLFSTIWYPWM